MANIFFSGRIPPDLYNKVEQHCNEFGESKTKVLIDALATYLNFPIPVAKEHPNNQVSKELFLALEERVKTLERLISATKEDKSLVISSDNNDNQVNAELEVVPNVEIKKSDNKIDNAKVNNDNKQLEINEVINFDNKKNNLITSNVLVAYGPVNENQMATWAGKDRGLLRRHREKLEKKQLSLDTPLLVEVNRQTYELKCISQEKLDNKIARKWIAQLADNTDNNIVSMPQEDSD